MKLIVFGATGKTGAARLAADARTGARRHGLRTLGGQN